MNINEINQRIQDIEEEWKMGDTDYQDATYRAEEALKDFTSEDDKVIHFKDFKPDVGMAKHHIQTNIKELDNLTGGMGKGDLILISGDTGDGKSSFARFLIRKFSEQKKNSLVFSYEESNQEFLEKFMGNLPDGYLPKVLTDNSTTWIEAKILQAVNDFKVEIVFIDTMEGIVDYRSKLSEVGVVSSIIQRLKAIAIKYNVVMFLMCGINKSETGLIDKNSITGSKIIVKTASVGIALSRGKEKPRNKEQLETEGVKFTNYTNFYLIKNRYKGKYDNFSMLFHPETGLYTEKQLVDQEDIKIDFN